MLTTRTNDIATARLILRPLTAADADTIARLAGDEQVARWTALVPHPYPDGEAARFVARVAADTAAHVRAIALKDAPDALIGVIGLHPADEDAGRVEIGYWLGRPYWGRGLMGEAIAAAVADAQYRVPGATLFAKVFPGNTASIRVLEGAGFIRRGTSTCNAPARAERLIKNAPLYELALAGRRAAS